MKHLIICREYPPAPGGGIGTYVSLMARLLAQSGETVHVIGQLWAGATKEIEESLGGHLIVHRIPYLDWTSFFWSKPYRTMRSKEARRLFYSKFPPQCFSWLACLLAERLVEQEGIDTIEAQDYEAPLYYLQVRRVLGVGPTRQPPCIVHLHSPTHYIARSNEWDMSSPAVIVAKELEDYSITSADALLCPSRYLANQVEIQYGLSPNSIANIPYPTAEEPIIERNSRTWQNGTICYVGRLERRKGVIEWIDAATAVAEDYPKAQFEFIGADTVDPDNMSCEELVRERIPKRMKRRFRFRGNCRHSILRRYLTKARMAVVPSRWENFPNTCIEAMSSGLPIIASREGGMVEMLQDGQTGWLAKEPGCEGLAEALQRALRTPADKLSVMGRTASKHIRELCDNKQIVDRQLRLRREVVERGSTLHLSNSARLWEDSKVRYFSTAGAQPISGQERWTRKQCTLELGTGMTTLESQFKLLRKLARHPGKNALMIANTLKSKILWSSRFWLGC